MPVVQIKIFYLWKYKFPWTHILCNSNGYGGDESSSNESRGESEKIRVLHSIKESFASRRRKLISALTTKVNINDHLSQNFRDWCIQINTCVIESSESFSGLGVVRFKLYPHNIWWRSDNLWNSTPTEFAKNFLFLVSYFDVVIATCLGN